MNRITNKDLEIRIEFLNKITDSPLEYSTLVNAGGAEKYIININHYHIDGAYGGVKLVRTVNASGGIEVISRNGFGTKRELYTFLNAYIDGIRLGQEK